jgi:rubredoxin-NAD+ reductase
VSALPATAEVTVWHCELCGFTYDEAKGHAPEGFTPGTRWEDIPNGWGCPDCGQPKADFHQLNC